ncbi:MAG: sugar-binding transcriptional regulator [Candidatus Acetothermia bacterium]
MNKQEKDDLLVRVAWYYHKLELTQKEVGEKLGLSRQKVQRLLKEAREKGIIKVQIENPKVNLLKIEEKLKDRYSLSDAVIAPCPSSGDKLRDSLGRVASTHIRKLVENRDIDVLGTGWGRTLRAFVDHFQPTVEKQNMDVVSLIGNLLTDTAVNPYEIANTLARKLSANCYNIWAPSIVEDENSAEIFRQEEWIRETLEKTEAADLLIVGLGPVSERATLYNLGYISNDDLETLQAQGAVGDILGRYFDENGELVDLGLHERVIASSFKQIRDGKGDLIVVGGGDFKLDAMRGALKGDLIDVLITDE